jgi:A/G-specific adenine glycosylase
VLLERRPEQGIWAGLWGLPECPAAPADAVQARDCTARVLAAAGAASQADAPPVSVEPLPPFEHALTHFRLWLSPWRVGLAADPPPAAEPAAGYRWLTPADAGAARATTDVAAAKESTILRMDRPPVPTRQL